MVSRNMSDDSQSTHDSSLVSSNSTMKGHSQHSNSEVSLAAANLHKSFDHIPDHPYLNLSSFDSLHGSHKEGGNMESGHRTDTPSSWHGFKPVLRFVVHSPVMLFALLLGSAGSLACFAFTYWLASQIFICPTWTVECEVGPAVRFFTYRLGLVQGILSTIFGLSVAGMVYTIHQLAEVTIWPLLCSHAVPTRGIDRFLMHARGSLSALPRALQYTRHSSLAVTVLLVGLIGLLMEFNSTLVGWAFTVMPISTSLTSLHMTGGKMGFGFTNQANPPLWINGEVQRAAAMYASWSNLQSVEVLPELRDFIIDRNNLSTIGDFTVNAVQVKKNITCYPYPINIVGFFGDGYLVQNNLPANFTNTTVAARLSGNGFSSWVDKFDSLSDTRSLTTVVFAAFNSTIDGGHHNADIYPKRWCQENLKGSCGGISTLACDVDIDLIAGQACNGPCSQNNNSIATLSWMGPGGIQMSGKTKSLSQVGIVMAAAATQFGQYMGGFQPMYNILSPLPNSTYGLPIAFTDMQGPVANTTYSQANLTNFIHVAIGAVAMAMPQGWPGPPKTVESTVDLLRMARGRAFVLLAPPSMALLGALFLVGVCAIQHHRAGLDELRLGSTTEILLSATEGNVVPAVEKICRRGSDAKRSLEWSKWRFDHPGDDVRGGKRRLNLDDD